MARCTVERLMRRNGWQGVRRQQEGPHHDRRSGRGAATGSGRPPVRGGRAQPAARRRLHLRQAGHRCVRLRRVRHRRLRRRDRRDGRARRPSRPVRRIGDPPGRRTACPARPSDRGRHPSPDAGSQYTSVRFGETLCLSGLRPSVGSVGDAYDNALAETTIGLYKTECIRADSPFRRGPLTHPRRRRDTSPPTRSPGTTTSASCTASAASHPPKPKPTTIPNP